MKYERDKCEKEKCEREQCGREKCERDTSGGQRFHGSHARFHQPVCYILQTDVRFKHLQVR